MTTPTYNQNPNSQTNNLLHGGQAVATAGIPVQVSASLFTHECNLQARPTNTGYIIFGGPGVPNDLSEGFVVSAGQPFPLSAFNLNNVWMNSTIDGDGICYIYRG